MTDTTTPLPPVVDRDTWTAQISKNRWNHQVIIRTLLMHEADGSEDCRELLTVSGADEWFRLADKSAFVRPSQLCDVELLHLQERLGHAGDLLLCSFAQ
jgi:hypothetical protein